VREPRLSAGVVVVRPAAAAHLFLLLRAFRNWDFPKGMVEADEDPLAAARREVREESGITDLVFPWGEGYIETAPYNQNKIARYYLAVTAAESISLPVNPQLGTPEHHEWRWCTGDEALALLPPRLLPVLRWATERIGP
jgi:8-oxo-dGTP pyrophosphatase MutT (NUDIX family)